MPNDITNEAGTRFTKFSFLQIEIRLMIWRLAAPKPRDICSSGGILAIVNFELAHPRCILPAPQDLSSIYRKANALDDNRFGALEIAGRVEYNVQIWKSNILNLLHTSRESRPILLGIYQLDITSVITEDNNQWWEEEDVVYFPSGLTRKNGLTVSALLLLMSTKRGCCLHCLPSIRHIAIEATPQAIYSLGLNPIHSGETLMELVFTGWPFDWPQNFPRLQTMSLLFDPGDVGHREQGTIKLYEPYDVVVNHLNLKPSQIDERASSRLQEMATLEEPNGNVDQYNYFPEVKCSVMCWKKPRDIRQE